MNFELLRGNEKWGVVPVGSEEVRLLGTVGLRRTSRLVHLWSTHA